MTTAVDAGGTRGSSASRDRKADRNAAGQRRRDGHPPANLRREGLSKDNFAMMLKETEKAQELPRIWR